MKQATHGDLFVRCLPIYCSPTLIFPSGASMTLVGLLPPLCDNGHMHVDGGYSEHLVSYTGLMLKKFLVDNLPVRAT